MIEVYFMNINVRAGCPFTIRNVGKVHASIEVIIPTSFQFDLFVIPRIGLAPGTERTYSATFTPTSFSILEDSLTVMNGTEPIVVPFRALPAYPHAIFPPTYSFGKCDIGIPVMKTFVMESAFGIEYPFQLDTPNTTPSLTTSVTRGVIPSQGKVEFTVTFLPTVETIPEKLGKIVLSGKGIRTQILNLMWDPPDDARAESKKKTSIIPLSNLLLSKRLSRTGSHKGSSNIFPSHLRAICQSRRWMTTCQTPIPTQKHIRRPRTPLHPKLNHRPAHIAIHATIVIDDIAIHHHAPRTSRPAYIVHWQQFQSHSDESVVIYVVYWCHIGPADKYRTINKNFFRHLLRSPLGICHVFTDSPIIRPLRH
ncbi:hypothetical protein BLNAU_12921 [Blattamonas nauphoetae]|uniref:Abnormal spindle-like microcephaly-associated protein ASH domain-containing protein n=1 Tax=Blattamonas nauphoetae TaxID=2049346 RepID=A0ABQ9XKS0_9EUKA|nr:hypothetical protein BLNAU_12921 [Blattamonas nauphoetae]